jgi:ADP-ribose pyrophosphatase YjhB (NUDIX family)
LPGVWGLPAITLARGELPEAALCRLGREKLGVVIEPRHLIGIKASDRESHQLILMDIEAELVDGEPNVLAATGAGTRYVEQRWTQRLDLLEEAAARGSLCCQILLEAEAERA